MQPPKIENSTKEERQAYVIEAWKCLHTAARYRLSSGIIGYGAIVDAHIAYSGSSVGIRAAHNREEFLDAVDYAISFTSRIIHGI